MSVFSSQIQYLSNSAKITYVTSNWERCNNIDRIYTTIRELIMPLDIKAEAVSFYLAWFGAENWVRSKFEELEFKMLKSESSSDLEMGVTMKEVKEALWSVDGLKTSCSNRFNFSFYKKAWCLWYGDWFFFFFRIGHMPKGFGERVEEVAPRRDCLPFRFHLVLLLKRIINFIVCWLVRFKFLKSMLDGFEVGYE